MSNITLIEQQQKNKQRFNIYIDDQFAFGVGEQTLLFFALHKGMAITTQQKKQILKYDQFQKLYLAGVNYISYRMRSEKEVYDKLLSQLDKSDDEKTKQLQERMATLAIKQLKQDGYINDQQFVASFIEESLTFNAKGDRYIQQALQKKGIDSSLIIEGLEQIDYTHLFSVAENLAKNYVNKQSNTSTSALKQKVLAHLQQRGFQLSLSKQVVDALDFSKINQQQLNFCLHIAKKQLDKLSQKHNEKDLWYTLKTYLFQKGFSSSIITQAIQQLKEDYAS